MSVDAVQHRTPDPRQAASQAVGSTNEAVRAQKLYLSHHRHIDLCWALCELQFSTCNVFIPTVQICCFTVPASFSGCEGEGMLVQVYQWGGRGGEKKGTCGRCRSTSAAQDKRFINAALLYN